MYNTGQYDYQILQVLQQILSAVEGISTVVDKIVSNWFPITVSAITVLALISLVKWVVKL